MPFETILTRAFEKQLAAVVSRYPRSETHLRMTIAAIADDPARGDRYPGFGAMMVRKARIGLPEYGLSQARGLRLLALWLVEESKFVPLLIYRKADYAREHRVRENLQRILKEILPEISGC